MTRLTMNPYKKFVADSARMVREARHLPLGGLPPAPRPTPPANAPKALFFAPHPDDECIVGAIALRVFREAKLNLVNVAVTQGSRKERQAERYRPPDAPFTGRSRNQSDLTI